MKYSHGGRTQCAPTLAAQSISKENHLKNIFVGNLAWGATESGIRALFERYGTVDRVNLVTDRDTGQSRGFAFVGNERFRSGGSGNQSAQWRGIGRTGFERQRGESED